MKIVAFPVGLALAAAVVSACSSLSSIQRRELQVVPQGPFRPAAPGPQAANEFMPGPPSPVSNVEALPPIAQPVNAPVAVNTEADTASTNAPAPTAATTTATAGGIAPGQPTIMVILPDFLAAGSGWSSYSDDASNVKTPATEQPQATDKPTSASSSARLSGLAAAAVALSMATVGLGLSTSA